MVYGEIRLLVERVASFSYHGETQFISSVGVLITFVDLHLHRFVILNNLWIAITMDEKLVEDGKGRNGGDEPNWLGDSKAIEEADVGRHVQLLALFSAEVAIWVS